MEVTATVTFTRDELRALRIMAEFAKEGMEALYKEERETKESAHIGTKSIGFYGNEPGDSRAAYELACKLEECIWYV